MAFAENMAPFFSTSDFASAATIGGATVLGIFDDRYVGSFGEIENNAAGFTCAAADVTSAEHGDAVTLGSSSYTIGSIEREHGIARLRLIAA